MVHIAHKTQDKEDETDVGPQLHARRRRRATVGQPGTHQKAISRIKSHSTQDHRDVQGRPGRIEKRLYQGTVRIMQLKQAQHPPSPHMHLVVSRHRKKRQGRDYRRHAFHDHPSRIAMHIPAAGQSKLAERRVDHRS